jgi:hypothetical protein
MSVVFLTLLLGLVNGPRQITLDAGDAVSQIALLLDGQEVARIPHAPWTTRIDLGADLLPHHLEARALGGDGSEVARAEQWINLPRPAAEVEIALEGTGRSRTVRLGWQSVTGEAPTKVKLVMDGKALHVDGTRRATIDLPDAGNAHVLTAELTFPSGVTARKDVVVTGDIVDGAVATELTAIPVRPRAHADQVLPAKDLEGRLTDGGKPITVRTVDRESAEIYVVRSNGAETDLLTLASHLRGYGSMLPDTKVRFHVVRPVARIYHEKDAGAEIFDFSASLNPKARVLFQIANVQFRNVPHGTLRAVDAVAIAGLEALSGQTPRAVVLLLSGHDPADASVFLPSAVRAYLAANGIPLYVWALPSTGATARAAWGAVDDIGTPWQFEKAYQQLEQDVLSQQLVWLDGRHLPQSIALTPAADPDHDFELLPHAAPNR